MFEFLIVAALAWGVLAFGAVYAWAYWPLLALASGTGLWGLLRGRRSSGDLPWLWCSWVAIGVAIVCQLVPLPVTWLLTMSSARDRLLRNYDLGYTMTPAAHGLSIDPSRTMLGLACFAALAIFSAGCTQRLTLRRAANVARAITVLGIVIAVIGLVQKTSGTSLIYGFWRPIHHSYQIFGPFVNKNHYAGWMIMALGLALGTIGSTIAASARQIRPGWRNRLLWLSSAEANYVGVALFGVPLMVAALLMTLSRSGIVAFGVALAIAMTCLAVRARGNTAVIVFTVGYGTAAMFVVNTWSRLNTVTERFGVGSVESLSGRVHAWHDATHIARDFPVAGTGLNTFDTAMIFYQSQTGGHWDAAHNDYVQLAAEGGLLLLVPIALAVVVFVRLVARRLQEDADDASAFWLRFGAMLGLGGIAIQECLDFSLQLPGNAAMCALLVAIAVYRPKLSPNNT